MALVPLQGPILNAWKWVTVKVDIHFYKRASNTGETQVEETLLCAYSSSTEIFK
jgi:hypothetical protein